VIGADIIGAGLAGCEAASTLAALGHNVRLFEQKPVKRSPAHTGGNFAELVCSNSLKAERLGSASGLLKAEMRVLGSLCLEVADTCRVPAGGALAVDRSLFSQLMTEAIESNPNIEIVRGEVTDIDRDRLTVIATGPLTEGVFADKLSDMCGDMLSFYDAAAPIIAAHSIDMDKVHAASRYSRGGDDYLNCFFDKAQYEAFHAELLNARSATLHELDGGRVYEGCMPVEKLAQRGLDTMRFGPLKPVGLINPDTGRRPWAAVQLRKENAGSTMYNMVGFQTNLAFPEQKRVFSMIPGLENAEFVRYGVMHRNTFINSPEVLNITLNLKSRPNIFIAGQLTGFEGYMESAACGILAARFAHNYITGKESTVPNRETMLGALLRYITAPNSDFQPMGANMGILPPLDSPIRDKRERYAALAHRAIERIKETENEDCH